jgi:hypothetical protein
MSNIQAVRQQRPAGASGSKISSRSIGSGQDDGVELEMKAKGSRRKRIGQYDEYKWGLSKGHCQI